MLLFQASNTAGDPEIQMYILLIGTALIIAVGLVATALGSSSSSNQFEYLEVDDNDTDPWRELTDEHDIEFVGGITDDDLRHVTGGYRGEAIQVYEERHKEQRWGHTSARSLFTHYEIDLPAFVPREMELYERNFAQRLMTLIGEEEIRVGHEKIDATFVVRGTDPDRVRRFLERDEVADLLVTLYDEWSNIRIDSGTLILMVKGQVYPTHEDALDDLVDAVERLREARTSDDSSSEGHVADLSET